MRIKKIFVILVVLVIIIPACDGKSPSATQIMPTIISLATETQTPSVNPPSATAKTVEFSCTPTLDDGLSPSYKPNAPIQSHVGTGHVLTGVLRSSVDCTPIAGAKIELWPEYSNLGHPDEARATIFTDDEGRYRFECDPPEHIHMRISAEGYRAIAQNSYHPNGLAGGTFDIVLVPDEK